MSATITPIVADEDSAFLRMLLVGLRKQRPNVEPADAPACVRDDDMAAAHHLLDEAEATP